jgi:hypothetical protein
MASFTNAVENMSTMAAETRVDWADFMREMKQAKVELMQERNQARMDFIREMKQAKSPSSAIQCAMGILEDEYRSKLSMEEYLEAVSVIENHTKALVFCAIAPGDVRDSWLSREIAKISKQ